MLKEAKVHSWDFPSINPTHMCAVQAPQTLGWGSGKGGPGESLSGASCPSLPKNQDDFLCPCWHFIHGGSVYRPGNIYLFFFFFPQFDSNRVCCCVVYSILIFVQLSQMWQEMHPKPKWLHHIISNPLQVKFDPSLSNSMQSQILSGIGNTDPTLILCPNTPNVCKITGQNKRWNPLKESEFGGADPHHSHFTLSFEQFQWELLVRARCPKGHHTTF